MRLSIETRANLPEFYRDEEDRIRKLQVMENSQFHKLLSVKAYTCSHTLIKALGDVYDWKSRNFKLGKSVCKISSQDVAYLLGLRNSGNICDVKESAAHQIPDFYTQLYKKYGGTNPDQFSKVFLNETLKALDVSEESQKEDFRKLIYFYILCFVIFPTSQNAARKSLFSLLDDMESRNWTPVILDRIHESLKEMKDTGPQKSRKKEEAAEAVVEEGGEKEDGNDDGQRKRKTRKVKFMKFFTPVLAAWFYAKTGQHDPSIGDAGLAPFVNCLGKVLYNDESSYLVKEIDESKLKECIFGDNADNAYLKFNYRVGDNVFNTLVNDYSDQVLKHCLQEKLSVARNLGIEMSEKEILNDMRRKLLFSLESDANNTALIKALISFPQTTRDAVDNSVSPAQKGITTALERYSSSRDKMGPQESTIVGLGGQEEPVVPTSDPRGELNAPVTGVSPAVKLTPVMDNHGLNLEVDDAQLPKEFKGRKIRDISVDELIRAATEKIAEADRVAFRQKNILEPQMDALQSEMERMRAELLKAQESASRLSDKYDESLKRLSALKSSDAESC